jgi:comEA protein
MKRTLFFWIDKLQIRRGERIAISVLLCLFLMSSSVLFFVDFSPSPDDFNYEELEQVFLERSKIQQAEHDAIMARYSPEAALPASPAESEDVTDAIAEGEKSGPNVKTYETAEPQQQLSDTTRININKADAEQLQVLPGIGPAYASRIVEWREENGRFETIDQLLEIRGIGPARLENIRPLVVL